MKRPIRVFEELAVLKDKHAKSTKFKEQALLDVVLMKAPEDS